MYRGIDDYQHSWVIDLLMKYLVGIQPTGENKLILDPLPFEVESFRVEDIRYRGRSVDVIWDHNDGFTVTLNGVMVSHTTVRQRVEINL